MSDEVKNTVHTKILYKNEEMQTLADELDLNFQVNFRDENRKIVAHVLSSFEAKT